ncbi:ABC transporter ATP-binding protein [Paenibacillus sp. 1011MAR3C5]|uniref:ABC transporter ATP-binding protein n=1 Tax=Paenibacillus sp. 1011MAR3C5 TaxID=1675787 RepID=UPI000E6B84E4|nr:ABC transporter ATP-binding protein [Paenibacillus sp. 1011MAR3C5]RJE88509.1 ABC transporter ATP-binding protein [Paenibacillus sp. 1011MAR3C5]
MNTSSKQGSSLSIIILMLRRAKKQWLSYTGVSMIAIVASLLPVGWAEAMRRLFDAAYALDGNALSIAALWFGAIFAAELLISFVQAFLMQRLSNRTTLNLQRDILNGLFIMRLVKYNSWHTGDKLQRMNQSAVSAQAGLNEKLPELVQNVLSIVFLFAYLTVLSWQLMAGALVAALLIPLLSNMLGKPIRINQERTNTAQAETDAALLDQLQGAEVTRSFNRRKDFNQKWVQQVEITRRRWLRTDMYRAVTNSAIMIGFLFGQTYIFGMGAWMVVQSTLGIGAIAAFILSYERIIFPLAHIANTWAAVQDAIAHAGRALELAEQPADSNARQSGNGDEPPGWTLDADISLESCTFRYDGNPVLQSFTATFRHGQKTAIVGPSGSGKSTLLKLLLGLYPPDEGIIRHGATPLHAGNWKQWRDHAAYLPQDSVILDATVADNIRIGKLDATDEEIRQAALLANAHSFIKDLPGGYEHRLGEGGGRLSGGQKQRLALARAYIRNPRVLLLDEPTSALDAANEAAMQEALRTIAKGRTVIVVAHRLSTVRDADCILYVEDGQCMESGTHQELMQMQGRYAALVQAGDWQDNDTEGRTA